MNDLSRAHDARMLQQLLQRIEDLEQAIRTLGPNEERGLYLPGTPRMLNPVTATVSSFIDYPLTKRFGGLLGFGATLNVTVTNDAANYYTMNLRDLSNNIVAAFNTSAIAPGWNSLFTKTVVVAPSLTSQMFFIQIVKTGLPGSMYINPYCVIL